MTTEPHTSAGGMASVDPQNGLRAENPVIKRLRRSMRETTRVSLVYFLSVIVYASFFILGLTEHLFWQSLVAIIMGVVTLVLVWAANRSHNKLLDDIAAEEALLHGTKITLTLNTKVTNKGENDERTEWRLGRE